MKDIDVTFPDDWPLLTVIVAACDEEETIREAMTSLFSAEYPRVEFICVNDRSTDNTGQIMEHLRGERPNVEVLHIHELPPNWIGKTHAMHSALQRASGEWVLFTDADVHFSKDALMTSMAHALAEKADHLTLYPIIEGESFWLKVTIRAFTWLYLTRFKAERMAHASTRAYAGYGGFNLIRREALDATAGLEWLKMEVVDDVGLGFMLNQTGAKSLFAMGTGFISIEWYPNLGSMFRGLAKNTFGSVAHYSIVRTIWMVGGGLFFLLAPLASVVWLSAPQWLSLLGYLCLASLIVDALIYKYRNSKQSFFLSLLAPAGIMILNMISVYSMVMCYRANGVIWRGTYYALAELRKHQRLKL